VQVEHLREDWNRGHQRLAQGRKHPFGARVCVVAPVEQRDQRAGVDEDHRERLRRRSARTARFACRAGARA